MQLASVQHIQALAPCSIFDVDERFSKDQHCGCMSHTHELNYDENSYSMQEYVPLTHDHQATTIHLLFMIRL